MSDDIPIRIDPRPAEAGARRVEAALKNIGKTAVSSIGSADRQFSKLYNSLNGIGSVKGFSASTISSVRSMSAALKELNAISVGKKLDLSGLRIPDSKNIERLRELGAALQSLSGARVPSGSAIGRISQLAAATKGFSMPSSSQIKRLGELGVALQAVGRVPSGAAVSRIASLSAAVSGFRSPTANAATNLQAFFNVLNNARFSSGLATNLRSLAAAVTGLSPFAGLAHQLANGMGNLGRATQQTSGHMLGLRSNSLSLGQAFLRTHAALQSLTAVLGARAILEAGTQFQKMELALNATVPGIGAAAGQMQFATDVANRYGVSLGALGPSYAQLLASAQGTNVTLADSQRIFEGVTQAVRVYGLSTADADGVYRALTQIISKGSLQMEELRGQLGDRLPGAVQIFAKGLGVTTQELMKMTKAGEVTGETLRVGLLGFADELKNRTGGSLEEAINTVPAALARLQTAFVSLSATMIKGGFGDAIITMANGLAQALSNPVIITALSGIGRALSAIATLAIPLTALFAVGLVNSLRAFSTTSLIATTGVWNLTRGILAQSAAAALLNGNLAGAARGVGGLAASFTTLNAALGIIGIVSIAVTALFQAYNSGAQLQKSLEEGAKSLGNTMLGQAGSVEAAKGAWQRFNAVQKTKEILEVNKALSKQDDIIKRAALSINQNASSMSQRGPNLGFLADFNESFSVNRLNTIHKYRLEALGLADDMAAIENPAGATALQLNAVAEKLGKVYQGYQQSGRSIPGWVAGVQEGNAAALEARRTQLELYNTLDSYGKLTESQKATRLMLVDDFKKIEGAAFNTADAISSVTQALQNLNSKGVSAQILRDLIKKGDRVGVLAELGRSSATAEEAGNVSTAIGNEIPLSYANQYRGRDYNKDSVAKIGSRERTAADAYAEAYRKRRERTLYATTQQGEYDRREAGQEAEEFLGVRSSRGSRSRSSPYSVDTDKDYVTELKKYFDPGMKATNAFRDVNDALAGVMAKQPGYLREITGLEDTAAAAAMIRAQAYTQIKRNLEANIPELQAAASAESEYEKTVDSINALYRFRAEEIRASGATEAEITARLTSEKVSQEQLLSNAELRRVTATKVASISAAAAIRDAQIDATNAVLEAEVNSIQRRKDALRKNYELSTYSSTRDTQSALGGLGLAMDLAFDSDTLSNMRIATDEWSAQQDYAKRLLDVNKELAARYGDDLKVFQAMSAEAERLLRAEYERKKLVSRQDTVASMTDPYRRRGTMGYGDELRYAREKAELEALANRQVSPTNVDYTNYSEADASRARQALEGLKFAYADTILSSTTFGQAISSTMSKAGQAISDFVMTGKLDMRSFITDILSEILRLVVIEPMIQSVSRSIALLWQSKTAGGVLGGAVQATQTVAAGTTASAAIVSAGTAAAAGIATAGTAAATGLSASGTLISGSIYTSATVMAAAITSAGTAAAAAIATAAGASGASGGGTGGLISAGMNLALAFIHNGGIVGSSTGTRGYRLHSGGIVPRGGVSAPGVRSWELLTQLPKGSEVLTQYDSRHRKNMRSALLKAGEEVLMPEDPRHFNNRSRLHSGGFAGDGPSGYRDPFRETGAAMVRGGDDNRTVNHIQVNIPANASRGPQADTELVKKFAEELERHDENKTRTANAYRTRNSRSMQVN